MKSRVLALSGLPGVGKTTASVFFRRKRIPVIRMGQVTDNLIKRQNLPPTEKNEKLLRVKIRNKYGKDIYAKKSIKKILLKLRNSPLVVIEGIRSIEEIGFFQDRLKELKVIYIEAPKIIRYIRLKKRKTRPLKEIEIKKRDRYEIELGILKVRQLADYIIKNNQTFLKYYQKLSRILND